MGRPAKPTYHGDETMTNERDLNELLDEFQNQEEIHCLEGSRGIRSLEKIITAIGENADYGSTIEEFLSNNSGAIEAIVLWIGEQNVPEWKETLEGQLLQKCECCGKVTDDLEETEDGMLCEECCDNAEINLD